MSAIEDARKAIETFGGQRETLRAMLAEHEQAAGVLRDALGDGGIEDRLSRVQGLVGKYGPALVKWGKRFGLLAGGAGALELGPVFMDMLSKAGGQ